VEGTSCCDEHASDVVSRNHMPEPVVGRPSNTGELLAEAISNTEQPLAFPEATCSQCVVSDM